jgi:hypothetical protein
MGHYARINMNDTPDGDALGWARVAGLVEIHDDGSWQLTPQGLTGMLELLGQAHPFRTRSAGHDRRRTPYLV